MTITAISYGGGVQSTAMIVLATQGMILADVALFANVGDDSEYPETLAYVRDIATPFAKGHGLDVIEVARDPWPTKSPHTLLSHIQAYNGCQGCGATPGDDCYPDCPARNNTGGDLPIPMKLDPSRAPVSRSCTKHWKIGPIRRWLRDHGATVDDPAELLLGISTDELHRATNNREPPIIDTPAFPLLDYGLSRTDCAKIITDAGLPVPPKSACWFCPFHRPGQWAERRRDDPDLFAQAVELEDNINVERARRGLQRVLFLGNGKPLADLTEAQPTLWSSIGDDGCDEGVCFV